jgi:hypothetical protein
MIENKADELIIKYATKNGSIMELGNQIMNLQFFQDISAKNYYSGKGFKHTSIDQNGMDGALALDLSKPIDHKEQYDLVTDIGTMEHVAGIYHGLLNVFNFCKEDGIMIHKNPKQGNFPGHGYHYFTIDFWKEYVSLTKMEVLELFEYPIYHNRKDGWEIIAVLKKIKDSKSLSPKEFEKALKNIHSK